MDFLQFNEKVLRSQLLVLLEFRFVAKAFSLSEKGIHVGQTLNEVSELMLQMSYLKDFERMQHFLRMMDIP